MEVAIALAVSWKPLVKSNSRAVITTVVSTIVVDSIGSSLASCHETGGPDGTGEKCPPARRRLTISRAKVNMGPAEGFGYSATPQARKLGLKPGVRLAVVGPPPGWTFAEPLDDVPDAGAEGPADVLVWFVPAAAELDRMAELAERIFPAGAIWVAWPRKAAGHVSDVDENLIRNTALGLGLVDVKVAAIDEHWSGLKICWRKENRTPR
jgi:hypothetical protein